MILSPLFSLTFPLSEGITFAIKNIPAFPRLFQQCSFVLNDILGSLGYFSNFLALRFCVKCDITSLVAGSKKAMPTQVLLSSTRRPWKADLTAASRRGTAARKM
jgi:hypothetical protein